MENCEGKIHNIGMGCCQPVLAPIEYYYTKWQTERYVSGYTYSKEEIDEKTSGHSSGCCITPEEVDERIASAKTEIEAEIPSLSAYSTTEQMNTAINQSVSGKANASDVQTISGDLQTLSAEVQTIIISGVSGISSAECQSMIDSSISGKLDTSIFQPFSASVETSLGNKQDASGMTAYTQNTAFTAHTADTVAHTTQAEKNAWNAKSDFSGNYNDLTNKPTIPAEQIQSDWNQTNTASKDFIKNKPTIPSIWSGDEAAWSLISGGTLDANTIYLVY